MSRLLRLGPFAPDVAWPIETIDQIIVTRDLGSCRPRVCEQQGLLNRIDVEAVQAIPTNPADGPSFGDGEGRTHSRIRREAILVAVAVADLLPRVEWTVQPLFPELLPLLAWIERRLDDSH